MHGTVVHLNPAARSYTLAANGGRMIAVHAGDLPALGETISVPVRGLFNRTFAEDGRRTVSGHTRAIELGGIVTYVDATDGVYTVSRTGASVLVRVDGANPGSLPVLGDLITVRGRLGRSAPANGAGALDSSPAATPGSGVATDSTTPTAPTSRCAKRPRSAAASGSITQKSVQIGDTPLTYSDIEGILQGVCDDTGQILLSADDVRESGADIAITVPSTIDTGGLAVGDSVDVSTVLSEDGSYRLSGLSNDDGVTNADDSDLALGDQAAG
jgi:hypothetical protein